MRDVDYRSENETTREQNRRFYIIIREHFMRNSFIILTKRKVLNK